MSTTFFIKRFYSFLFLFYKKTYF